MERVVENTKIKENPKMPTYHFIVIRIFVKVKRKTSVANTQDLHNLEKDYLLMVTRC